MLNINTSINTRFLIKRFYVSQTYGGPPHTFTLRYVPSRLLIKLIS